jgi:hypothetical protein
MAGNHGRRCPRQILFTNETIVVRFDLFHTYIGERTQFDSIGYLTSGLGQPQRAADRVGEDYLS